MKTRTLENVVLGSLTMALATFILVWHYGVGTPVPDYILLSAAVPVVVATFSIMWRRRARKDRA